MNSAEIKALIEEITGMGIATNPSDALNRAKLLASYLQAYHLAIIGEEIQQIRKYGVDFIKR